MFVSHDINSNKKKLQKPNILRRKTSASKASILRQTNKAVAYKSDVQTVLTSTFIVDQKEHNEEVEKLPINKNSKYALKRLKIDNGQVQLSNIHNTIPTVTAKNNMICIDKTDSTNVTEVDQNQSLNVESFLLDSNIRQNIQIFENELQQKALESVKKQKWCLDFSQDSHKIKIENYDDKLGSLYQEQKSDIANKMVPLAVVSSIRKKNPIEPQEFASVRNLTLSQSNVEEINFPSMIIEPLPLISTQELGIVQNSSPLSSHVQTLGLTSVNETSNIKNENFSCMTTVKMSMEQLICRPIKFKCDIDDCKKEFMSERKLKTHRNSHNKSGCPKVPRQTIAECPIKKILADGVEEPCGRIFHVREDLIKHLKEEHTLEEAAHRCGECGRRFYWASGLRVHARSHLVRANSLMCPWPGCSRVFRQPCRLKEHARAHTGDKPYSCGHPNCGWSFRTASKLMRHARRHTGDRRYACVVCNRAFLRREHLRDHVARHHAHARRIHNCPHTDCQHTFTNMSSLYMHMKKLHKKEEKDPLPATGPTENQELTKDVVTSENMFMVSLLEQSPLETETVRPASALSGHSARTHCTWPLARTDRYQADAFVLEEEAQVEQSESSESNIYTVRSDLFLHGNVLNNDDSEQMGRCVRVSDADEEGALALDADLMLDAPSVHLDQEELYTDPVDESAFRVFLLSGEELA